MRNSIVIPASILCVSLNASAVLAQTKEEIAFVTKTMQRKQTPASTLSYFAGLEQGKGKFTQALARYEAMLKIYAADPGLGPDCPKYGWGLGRKAQCLKALGREKEAVADSRRAIQIVSDYPPRVFPAEASYVIQAIDFSASVIGKPAVLKYFKEKKPIRRPFKLKPIAGSEIADIVERTAQTEASVDSTDKSNPNYYVEVLYLANLYCLQRKYALADPLFKQVIEWSKKTYAGKDNRYLLVPLSNYGFMLMQSGRIEDGKKIEAELKAIDDALSIPGLYRN